MTFLKFVGYTVGTAGVAVAVVVAAPIAGAVGTITAAGACIAGGSGALVGGVASCFDDGEEQAYKKGRSDGAKDSKAAADIELEQVRERLLASLAFIEGCENYFNLIVSVTAVAVASISSCRELMPSERDQFESFFIGHLANELPENIKNKISSIYDTPLSMAEAYELASDNELSMAAFDDVLNLSLAVMDASDDDIALISQTWSQLKAA